MFLKFQRALACILLVISLPASADSLSLLIWDEYIDPDVLLDFTKETGIQVETTVFNSGDDRDAIIAKQNGTGFDVIQLPFDMLSTYVALGWVRPLDAKRVPNLKHIDPIWQSVTDYAVPYFWGTIGIAWREDLIDRPPTSWREFIGNPEAWSNKFTMIDAWRDIYSLALIATGANSINAFSEAELNVAADALIKQQPHVYQYGYPLLEETAALATGELTMSVMYNGDAEYLKQFNKNIRFTIPEEGTFLWLDALAVAGYSKVPEKAHMLINFLNRPDIAARQADYVYYATPNTAALELMDAEYLNNPTIFPPAKIVAESEQLLPIGPKLTKQQQKNYFKLTRGKHN